MRKILLFMAVLVSCQTSDNNKDIAVQKIDYTENNITLTSVLPFKSIEVVPMKTPADVIISENMQLCELDGEIYVTNNLSQKGVYRFNKKGEFLNKISNHGKAQNEFLELSDISLTDEGNIALYSGSNGDVLYFSKDDKSRLFNK